MTKQKILIALSTNEELLRPLYQWGQRFHWEQISEVHFSHVVKKTIAPIEFGMVETPDESTFQSMQPTLQKFLEDEGKKIVSPEFQGKIFYHLSLDFNPEEEEIRYVNQTHADLLVVSTENRSTIKEFFHHSFSEHMIHHAPCDVLVVRPQAS